MRDECDLFKRFYWQNKVVGLKTFSLKFIYKNIR